jgi:hypothetical protein
MIKPAAAAVLLALTLALGAGGAAAQPSQAELWQRMGNDKLALIRLLIDQKRFPQAREEIADILSNGSFPVEIRGGAIMQRGHIAMRSGDYKGAVKDYQAVQQMPGTSEQLRKQAQTAAELADSFAKLRQ